MKFSKNFSPGKRNLLIHFGKIAKPNANSDNWGPWIKKKMICMAPGNGKNSTRSPSKTPTRQTEQDMWKIESNDFYFSLLQRQSKGLTLFQHKSCREKIKEKEKL